MWNLVICKADLVLFRIQGGKKVEKRTRGMEVKGKKRGKNKDTSKSVIYVLTEGNTEELYLKHFSSREFNVYVEPVDPEHTDAIGIVKFAKEHYIKGAKKINIKKGDRVYCVFDSDPKSNPNISQAFDLIKGSRSKGLRCIFSNPCFEIWFAMHYRNPPYGKNADEMKHIVKELLEDKENIKDYKETTDIYDYLKVHQEKALNRAIQLHNEQEKVHDSVFSHECNPYTNISKFIQHIEACKVKNKASSRH